jgi:hypothetical protein
MRHRYTGNLIKNRVLCLTKQASAVALKLELEAHIMFLVIVHVDEIHACMFQVKGNSSSWNFKNCHAVQYMAEEIHLHTHSCVCLLHRRYSIPRNCSLMRIWS